MKNLVNSFFPNALFLYPLKRGLAVKPPALGTNGINISKGWELYSVAQYVRTSALAVKFSLLIILTIFQVKSYDAL